MKKSILWIVVLVLSISMVAAFSFAGCKKEAAPAEEAAEEVEEVEEAPSEETKEVIELQVWDVFDPATSIDAVEREKLFRQYEEEHPGIKIQHNILVYGDLHEKAVVAGAAESGPDVLHMLGEWVPEFSMMGILEDVTDRVNAWEEKQYFPDATWEVASYKGVFYGIPSIASPRALLYREDYLKEAGFTNPPDTWDELKTIAQKVTQTIEGVYGFAFCSSSDAIRGPQEFLPFLWQTGAEWVVKDNDRWVPGFTVEQMEEVFGFYNDLMNNLKACPPDSIGWEYLEMDNSFVVGQSAMCHNGSWMTLYKEDAGDSFQYWKAAPMPANENRATYFEVKVEGIGKFSEHKDEAWEFLTWLMGKDQMAIHARHDNLPSRTDVISLPEFQENEWVRSFLEVIPDGKAYPPIPMAESNTAMMDELQAVLHQQKTPAMAAESLLATLEDILMSINE
jgi:multiple sugar transport system substrate-binding protein